MSELRARAGSTVITPSVAGELAGYAARDGAISLGSHDDLEAALLVVEQGDASVAWLTLDSIAVTAALSARLQEAVRAALQRTELPVVVVASHTHSGPLAWTGDIHPAGPQSGDAAQVGELEHRIGVLAGELAGREPAPVTAEWSTAPVEGLATNRHAPDGPHDATVGALVLRDAVGGAVVAILLDAAAHPTVLGPDNLQWSADWPGAMRDMLRGADPSLERFASAPGPVDADRVRPALLFLQGASGDVSTRFTRRGSGFDEVARLGGIAGAAALGAVLRGGRRLDGDLRVLRGSVTLERRALPTAGDAAKALAEAQSALDELDGADPLDPRRRLAQSRLDGARIQQRLASFGGTLEPVDLPITAVRLGPVSWLHLPFEPFAAVGDAIRERGEGIVRVIGYSDAYAGYLVDSAAERARVYEALTGIFPATAAERVVDAAADLLSRLAEPDVLEIG